MVSQITGKSQTTVALLNVYKIGKNKYPIPSIKNINCISSKWLAGDIHCSTCLRVVLFDLAGSLNFTCKHINVINLPESLSPNDVNSLFHLQCMAWKFKSRLVLVLGTSHHCSEPTTNPSLKDMPSLNSANYRIVSFLACLPQQSGFSSINTYDKIISEQISSIKKIGCNFYFS